MNIPIKHYKKEAFIYLSEKVPPKEFYIVKNGKIKISKTNPILGKSEEIKGVGYIFGIIQCITGIIEEETAMALTDLEVFVISKDRIKDLYINHKKVILKILSEYSEVLRKLDTDLTNYNFFPSTVDRKEKTFDIVKKYINLQENEKAAFLLNSILKEFPNDSEIINRVKSIMPDLKKSDFTFNQNKNIFEITLPAKKVVFTEFELANNFYVIKNGKVKITKLKHDEEMLLAVLNKGDIFGEMSILNDKPRNATAITEEETELMVIKKDSIEKLPPSIFIKLLEVLSKRIWMVQQQLICYKLPTITSKLYYLLTAKIKQEINNPEFEFESFYIFRFPLKELCEMVNCDYDKIKKEEIGDFLKDSNLEFFIDTIKVKRIKDLFDKNSYHFNRVIIARGANRSYE